MGNLNLYKNRIGKNGFVELKSRNAKISLFASLRLNKAIPAV